MAFKFNFSFQDGSKANSNRSDIVASVEDKTEDTNFPDDITVSKESTVSCIELNDMLVLSIAERHYQVISDSSVRIKQLQIQDYIVKILSPALLEGKLSESESTTRIFKALEHHSDLIPDVYEGGLKLWECAQDLAEYIVEHNVISAGMRVLELGCGAGLPGILSLKCGAKVDFQDFNCEVLNFTTIPNVLLNMEAPTSAENCLFIAGDWALIDKYIAEHNCSEEAKYDVILTSETIYNPKNQRKLLNLMKTALKSKGIVYLAAKTHYFGVGGGTRQFENLVKSDGSFCVQQGKTIVEGVQREILIMSFKRPA